MNHLSTTGPAMELCAMAALPGMVVGGLVAVLIARNVHDYNLTVSMIAGVIANIFIYFVLIELYLVLRRSITAPPSRDTPQR